MNRTLATIRRESREAAQRQPANLQAPLPLDPREGLERLSREMARVPWNGGARAANHAVSYAARHLAGLTCPHGDPLPPGETLRGLVCADCLLWGLRSVRTLVQSRHQEFQGHATTPQGQASAQRVKKSRPTSRKTPRAASRTPSRRPRRKR